MTNNASAYAHFNKIDEKNLSCATLDSRGFKANLEFQVTLLGNGINNKFNQNIQMNLIETSPNRDAVAVQQESLLRAILPEFIPYFKSGSLGGTRNEGAGDIFILVQVKK
ncbi:MAG: hypothetical protein H7281_17605 [Bacteriovorax sp.]|nr:hypothetical protein [Bacteriovorax sp.]